MFKSPWDFPFTSIRIVRKGTIIWWADVHNIGAWINRSLSNPKPLYRPDRQGD